MMLIFQEDNASFQQSKKCLNFSFEKEYEPNDMPSKKTRSQSDWNIMVDIFLKGQWQASILQSWTETHCWEKLQPVWILFLISEVHAPKKAPSRGEVLIVFFIVVDYIFFLLFYLGKMWHNDFIWFV